MLSGTGFGSEFSLFPKILTTPDVFKIVNFFSLSKEEASVKTYPGKRGVSIFFFLSFRLLQDSYFR